MLQPTTGLRDVLRVDDGRRPSMINAGRTPPSLHRSPSPYSPVTADGVHADVGDVRHTGAQRGATSLKSIDDRRNCNETFVLH